MKIKYLKGSDGWTIDLRSSRWQGFEHGEYPRWGIAMLFNRPRYGLGVSAWGNGWSRYVNLWKPKET